MGWLYDAIPEERRASIVRAVTRVKIGTGVEMLQRGSVGGVALLLLRGNVEFLGDPHKFTRDSGR